VELTSFVGRRGELAEVKRLLTGSRLALRAAAENHGEHILAKLGFTSRAKVAAWVAASTGNEQRYE
jgi:hypothetical protein